MLYLGIQELKSHVCDSGQPYIGHLEPCIGWCITLHRTFGTMYTGIEEPCMGLWITYHIKHFMESILAYNMLWRVLKHIPCYGEYSSIYHVVESIQAYNNVFRVF